MHDIKFIRENPEAFDAALARRGVEPQSEGVRNLDRKKRGLLQEIERLRAERKRLSAFYGQLASLGQGNTEEAIGFKVQSVETAQILSKTEASLEAIKDVGALLASLPNLPDPIVPDGTDESQNLEVSRWGTPRSFNFAPKEHADLGPALGLDFETGALISGARFTFLRGQMARLQRALGQFMLDRQTIENQFIECDPPLLVRDDAVFGTGQLPKFAEDLFKTSLSISGADLRQMALTMIPRILESADIKKTNSGEILVTKGMSIPDDVLHAFSEALAATLNRDDVSRRWLIPTAEVSLTNSVREQILTDAALPIRLTALTPCFRSEAGAAGKDTRGYIRQHQFEKVELVTICKPEDSAAEHEKMVKAAESILEALELPYRKMLLCAGDMGFTARKTFDLEVWLPGQDTYREISSISNCGDFQARRMNTRCRPEGAKGTEFVHTLNGSGLAVGRTLVAVLENYQQEDGSVTVPTALLPYMGGITALVPA